MGTISEKNCENISVSDSNPIRVECPARRSGTGHSVQPYGNPLSTKQFAHLRPMVRRPHWVRRTILCGDRPSREAFHITNASLKNNQSALSRAPSRPSSSISARKFHHHLNNLNQDTTVIRSKTIHSKHGSRMFCLFLDMHAHLMS